MKKTTLALTALLLAICAVLSPSLGVSAAAADEAYEAYLPEGCEVSSRFLEVLFGKRANTKKDSTNDSASPATLTAGGDVFGIRIKENCITVVDSRDCDDIKEGDISIADLWYELYGAILKAEGKIADGEAVEKTVEKYYPLGDLDFRMHTK